MLSQAKSRRRSGAAAEDADLMPLGLQASNQPCRAQLAPSSRTVEQACGHECDLHAGTRPLAGCRYKASTMKPRALPPTPRLEAEKR